MQTHDVSAHAKTGEALLALVVEDIKWSKETLKGFESDQVDE